MTLDRSTSSMSDDESRSGSESDTNDVGNGVETTGLIATRAKRSTAGNLYASLRANLDDEDVRRDLLAEDEEDDAGDYEGEDEEDEALESSSDEDDTGPPQEGQPEELAGETELKKAERVEQRKKRKAQDARLKLPAWQKKRVKLADDVKTEDGASTPSTTTARPKPKKKSERSNWLPTADDAPKRQSVRTLAVQNRETVHDNLKQSYERSEKQRRVMKKAAERESHKKRAHLSQAERLKMCDRIAKQTDREFGRWEREEAERQKARDEALAAKRRKGVEGAVVRWWSGSAVWKGERIEEKRVAHGSLTAEQLKDQPKGLASHAPTTDAPSAAVPETGPSVTVTAPESTPAPAAGEVPWLSGIHDYASRQPAARSAPTWPPNKPYPSSIPSQPPPITYPQPPSHTYSGWPPGSSTQRVSVPPPPPPAPLLREQALRTLIILSDFPSLSDTTSKPKTPRTANTTAGATPTDISSVILPDAYPPFSAEDLRYLLAKYSTKRRPGADNMPSPPDKPRCSIIPSQEAKYRDPKTGLQYLDIK